MSALAKKSTTCDKADDTRRPARKPRFKKRDGCSMPFITYGHPSDFTSNSTRKAVRSHVTARQHEAARAKAVAHRHRQQQSAPKVRLPKPLPGVEFASPGPIREHAVSIPSEVSSAANSLLQLRTLQARHLATVSVGSPSSASQVDSLFSSRPDSTTSFTPSRELSLPSFSQSFASEDQLPPSGAGSIFGDMIDYMQRIFTPLAWSALDISEQDGAIWQQCATYLSGIEPALYYSRLLFAAGILSQQGIIAASLCSWLYRKTVTTVREAISTEGRRTSEGSILALAYFACYETMFAEHERAQAFAMLACADAVNARGGLDSLDIPGSAKKVLCWTDTVVALKNQCEPLITWVERPSEQKCLHALRLWLPEHYAAIVARQSEDVNEYHKISSHNSGHQALSAE